jgi:hypothetical protein
MNQSLKHAKSVEMNKMKKGDAEERLIQFKKKVNQKFFEAKKKMNEKFKKFEEKRKSIEFHNREKLH